MLYQIQNSENKTTLLFVCQDMAIYDTWIEKRLTYQDLIQNNLGKIRYEVPLELEFEKNLFFKEHINSGNEFVSEASNASKIKQYKYLSEDKKQSLRILQHEEEDVYVFAGKKVESYEFSNILAT